MFADSYVALCLSFLRSIAQNVTTYLGFPLVSMGSTNACLNSSMRKLNMWPVAASQLRPEGQQHQVSNGRRPNAASQLRPEGQQRPASSGRSLQRPEGQLRPKTNRGEPTAARRLIAVSRLRSVGHAEILIFVMLADGLR